MTRAIQDISLVQRLVSFGFIALVIMVYAPLFGVGAMLMKSVSLTLLVVPLLPVIFVYTLKMAREMGESSREVQNKLSQLSSHTQENLSGIRTVQAGVQERNESDRFWKTNDAYAFSFFDQARINSLMSAWLPFFASLAQLDHCSLRRILSHGGKYVRRRLGLLFRLSLNVVSADKDGRFSSHACSASSGRVR